MFEPGEEVVILADCWPHQSQEDPNKYTAVKTGDFWTMSPACAGSRVKILRALVHNWFVVDVSELEVTYNNKLLHELHIFGPALRRVPSLVLLAEAAE